MDKSQKVRPLMITLGAGVSMAVSGALSTSAYADNETNNFQTVVQSEQFNFQLEKGAAGGCGAGKCGAQHSEAAEQHVDSGPSAASDQASKKQADHEAEPSNKDTSGKCGAGKCGAGKCGH